MCVIDKNIHRKEITYSGLCYTSDILKKISSISDEDCCFVESC